jgi:hypothetical protein
MRFRRPSRRRKSAARANVAARADLAHIGAPWPRRFHLVAADAIEFGLEIAGQHAAPRAQLNGVGQCLFEFAQPRETVRAIAVARRLENAAEMAQKILVGRRVQPAHARKFSRLLHQASRHAPRGGIEKHHADIDPLIAH